MVGSLSGRPGLWMRVVANRGFFRCVCFSTAMNIFEFAQFDESRFAPPEALANAYYNCVQTGYDRMRTSRAVIAGLARNVAHILPATILRIESLGRTFGDYDIVIYENDSTDHTRELLDAWKSINPRVHVLTEDLEAPVNRPVRCSSRARWMAYYRSCVRQYIVDKLAPANSVILIDTDLIGGWSPDGIAHTFGHKDWDFVGSNGMIYKRLGVRSNHLAHFDAWAYRVDAAMTEMATSDVNAILFERGSSMVPLYSCFGGLGIYSYDAFSAGNYDGNDMEHVAFHQSMCDAGHDRIFLNPSQIVVYGRKHRKLDPYFHSVQASLLGRRILGCDAWHFHRRSDFAHWSANQLRQMLETINQRAIDQAKLLGQVASEAA